MSRATLPAGGGLGIADQRTDKRIDFVGGGLPELARRVDGAQAS